VAQTVELREALQHLVAGSGLGELQQSGHLPGLKLLQVGPHQRQALPAGRELSCAQTASPVIACVSRTTGTNGSFAGRPPQAGGGAGASSRRSLRLAGNPAAVDAPGRSRARGGARPALVGWSIDQVIQVAGALLILAAYMAAQFGMLDQNSRLYLVLNLLGSAILAVLAWYEEQLGFLLLEGVWALVSAWSLLQVLRGAQPAAPHQ
jgi:hypothetical protein